MKKLMNKQHDSDILNLAKFMGLSSMTTSVFITLGKAGFGSSWEMMAVSLSIGLLALAISIKCLVTMVNFTLDAFGHSILLTIAVVYILLMSWIGLIAVNCVLTLKGVGYSDPWLLLS